METISEQQLREVQARLDAKQEGRIFDQSDREVIGILAGKNEAKREQAQAQARHLQELADAQRLREIRQAEAARLREEERDAALAQCRKDLKGALPVSLGLCSLGALHIVGAFNPDVALTAGGLLALAGVLYAGLAIFNWRSC